MTQTARRVPRKITATLFALVLCGCQSLPLAQCPQIPPLPAHLVKREPNLSQRLQPEFSASEPTATPRPAN